MLPFFISVPHSGEEIPNEVNWLSGLPENIVMQDVDRYVDVLYSPAFKNLQIPHVVTRWHRYVVDLNRLPQDVDQDSVVGSANPSGQFTTGLHWVKTTRGEVLMPQPISQELHETLVRLYFQPFHDEVKAQYAKFFKQGAKRVFHLDAHSMPSVGTRAHRDPGEKRAEIVVSDSDGSSCCAEYKDLVIQAYKQAGFQVGYNWPYKGGRVTQTYGQPKIGQEAIQVELNRSLYMNEESKALLPEASIEVSQKIEQALKFLQEGLQHLQ